MLSSARPPRFLFIALGLFGFFASSPGCGAPSHHEVLVKRAKAHETNKNWVEAAEAYSEACQLKPSDAVTCKRAEEIREYAVEIRTYDARKLCAAGQLAECLESLRPVRAMQSTNQGKVLEVLEQASKLAIDQCVATASSLGASLVELGCLQRWREALWVVSNYRAHFTERSKSAASTLATLAQAQPATALGAKMSYLQAAGCLMPLAADLEQLLRSTSDAFVALSSTTLNLKYSVNGTTRQAPGTCNALVASIGRGLRCDRVKSTHPELELSAEVFSVEPRWQQNYEDRQEVARYRAGTETLANPDYERARVEYELADQRFRDTERDTREREERCNQTQEASDCSAYDSIKRTYDDRLNELNRARSRFHNEPSTITRDVYKDHIYVVRTHRWSAPFRASVSLGGSASAPEVTTVQYTDVEQTGFPEAGVQTDRFEPPAANFFRDQSSQWLSQRLRYYIETEMQRRANDRAQNCSGDRIDCWATANYWLGTSELGLPLLVELAGKTPLSCTASVL